MRRNAQILLQGAAAVLLMWLVLRFVLPWTAPVLLAYSMAAILENAVRPMVRGGWRRKNASAVMTVAMLLLIILAAGGLVSVLADAASDFASEIPELAAAALERIRVLRGDMRKYLASAPGTLGQYLDIAADSVERSVFAVPTELSQQLMSSAGAFVQKLPDMLLFTVTAGIGTWFISAAYPQVTEFILRQLPENTRQRLWAIGRDIKGSFGAFLRAQFILMLISFFELLSAFLLLGVKRAFAAAAVTAFIDALPVFGVGIVLLPWAVFAGLNGDIGLALCLTLLWGVMNIVRSAMQAKLVGDRIGLDPTVSLVALYIGWRIWGVWGMLLLPPLFACVVRLNENGIIHLWK